MTRLREIFDVPILWKWSIFIHLTLKSNLTSHRSTPQPCSFEVTGYRHRIPHLQRYCRDHGTVPSRLFITCIIAIQFMPGRCCCRHWGNFQRARGAAIGYVLDNFASVNAGFQGRMIEDRDGLANRCTGWDEQGCISLTTVIHELTGTYPRTGLPYPDFDTALVISRSASHSRNSEAQIEAWEFGHLLLWVTTLTTRM